MIENSQSNENSESCSLEDTEYANSNKNRFQCMRLKKLLQNSTVDSRVLRELLWLGVPEEAEPSLRAVLWKLAMGYTPFDSDCRHESQVMKIREYQKIRNIYFSPDTGEIQSNNYLKQLKQIQVDTVRTHPDGYEKLFHHPLVQSVMIHVLLIWAIRNPASGYVQGLNDVVAPFIVVFLRAMIGKRELTEEDLNEMDTKSAIYLESQCYWCLSKLLSRVQDNFIFGQPGVVRMVSQMETILGRVAHRLLEHLRLQNIELFHVCFRWMNCFLTRDLPLHAVMRLWDTYIAEDIQGFSDFHVKVCTVLLIHWADELQSMDFQQIHLFLQALPTKNWGIPEVESLLSKAYILNNLFESLPTSELE